MSKMIQTSFDFGNVAKIMNLPNPTAAQDAATKAYVDSAVEGLAWKDNVRAATQANLNLASPGATIDGIAMAVNDRVLVRAQTASAENGIYLWNGAAVAMTRALDCSTADELENAVTTVDEGTSAGATYRQSTVNFTLGSGAVTWASFGTSVGSASEVSAGIIEIATQAETDAGASDATAVTPLKLATWSGRVKRFSQNVGDGSATSYTVTHNLNSRDCLVSVYRNSGAYDEVITDVEHTTVNSVTIKFDAAPAANAYRVSILS